MTTHIPDVYLVKNRDMYPFSRLKTLIYLRLNSLLGIVLTYVNIAGERVFLQIKLT